MSRIRVGYLAIGLVVVWVGRASAVDVSAKKLIVKDSGSKRLVQLLSKDGGIQLAGDPATNGAALHVYSATDDFCAVLAAGPGWVSKSNKAKYKNKATKTVALIQNGKLIVTVKSGVGFTLGDDGTQGVVNAQVQFGTGARYCVRCSGAKKDTASKFVAKDCAAAACAPEPSACNPPGTGTSTTSVPTTLPGGTTSTTTPGSGEVLKGALAPTPGRFNYNLTVGLPGANAACNANFAGTHACTYAELQAAETAGDLAGLKDVASNNVTSFWAIDPNAPALSQCVDDASGGSGLNWEYGTAHTPSRGQKVSLNNGAGTLGPLQTNLQCNLGGTATVGCCL